MGTGAGMQRPRGRRRRPWWIKFHVQGYMYKMRRYCTGQGFKEGRKERLIDLAGKSGVGEERRENSRDINRGKTNSPNASSGAQIQQKGP